MMKHLLSAYVVATPILAAAVIGGFGLKGRDIQPWPLILLIAYIVTAAIIVIALFRRKEAQALGGWFGGAAVAAGLLCLLFLADARDAAPILTSSGLLIAIGLIVLYFVFRPRLSEILKPALSGTPVVAGGITPSAPAEKHFHGDWIAVKDQGSTVEFQVRQRRTDRLMRAALLLVGMIVWTAASFYFAYAGFRADNVMLAFIAVICVLAGVLVLVAALVTVFPALWALKERATSSFAVTPEGVVLQLPGRDRQVFSYASLTGPYYLTSEDAARPQTIVRNGAPLIYAGIGIGGIAAVGSVAAVDSAHRLGSAVSNEIADKLRLVRGGSSGQVFIEHLAKPIVLARLLSDREARFLAEKVAEAMLRQPAGPRVN